MSHPYRKSSTFVRALLLSLMLHALAIATLVIVRERAGVGPTDVTVTTIVALPTTRSQAISFDAPAAPQHRTVTIASAEIVRVVSRSARAPKRAPQTSASQLVARRVARAPSRGATDAPRIATLAPVDAESESGARAPAYPAPTAPSDPPRAGAAVVTSTPRPASSPTPTPAPAVATPSPSAGERTIAAGGWGQTFEQPLVADDALLDALRARYPRSRGIRVEVDDAGRAMRVTFSDNLAQDIRAAIERALMEARYVPAECNGLPCDGTLRLEL